MQPLSRNVINKGDICKVHNCGMPVISVTSDNRTTDSSQDTEEVVEMTRKSMSISLDIDDAAAKERRQVDEMEFYLLWVDLRTFPGYAQFLTCCGGVFVFYLLYGYCQVRILHISLTLVLFRIYSVGPPANCIFIVIMLTI